MSEARNTGRQILIDIIDDFSPDKFVRFFREKNRAFAPRKEELFQYDDENFRNGTKLGEIQFAQDEQMVVCSFQAGQPLSERSGKKAQYEKGKKILKDSQSDAGIFIFYDKQGNFRFSLIYANYLGKKRDWSTFRRFTYFVSKEYTNKTFLLQIGEEDFSSLEKIKEAFSVEKVTKAFYTDIANWYFWAIQKTEFPKDAEKEESGRNIAVIRMITRLIFIWFMKERGLIRQDLFNYKHISTLLKDLSPKNIQYYKAILQNLFFATLNTKIEDRKFRFGKSFQGKNKDYMDHGIYRYEDYFKNKEDMLEIFKDIPFLNGGLFDCLDRRITENDKNTEIRIDGFTDKDVGLKVPNFLFFSDEINVDLNKEYGTKNKKYKVRGLMDTLSSYNFTIDENDPNDADVALDPELLGKVFENLLASFNPETATTARKQTGSFYTPREIVNYMVAESLMAYLSNKIFDDGKEDNRVRQLFVHTDEPHQFNSKEADVLISAIDNAKILDPACGSGAFPMGILHKLVHALGKLDPDNSKWKELQKQKAIKETEEAFNIGNKEERIKRLFDIDDAFENNSSDYGRKLYLIENCIFGVDIQPIAVQIAKLRFFISLLVDQNVKPKKENISIRPLPNLETKFVAANTLIGIERPAQGLLRNPEIDLKEAELHRVRERHFTARTPKIKQQCIEDDKRLRAEISGLHERDGFPVGVTEKLANWNPYDQNASADFFDPEWMFGPDVKDGFDVVIGNPPYITYKGKEVVNISDADIKQLISLYPNSAEYKVNSYALFTERGVNLLKKKGTLIYIIPSTIFQNEYLKKIRKYLITEYHISQIVSFANKVFGAVTDSIILKVNNNHSGGLKTIAIRKNDLDFSNLDDLKTYNPEKWNDEANDFVINLKTNKGEDEIISKIENGSIFLGSFLEANIGIKRADAPIVDRPQNGYKKFLVGRNINKFVFEFPNAYILFDKSLFHTGIDENIFKEKEKILVRKTGNKLIAVLDSEQYYTDQSIYNLYPKKGKAVNLKVITALLNSPMLEYYFNKKMITNPDVFPYIKGIHLKKLPIKFPKNHSEEKQFETLVEKIIEGKKENKDTSEYEKQIDQMVYKLYGLTPEEIAIVEGKE